MQDPQEEHVYQGKTNKLKNTFKKLTGQAHAADVNLSDEQGEAEREEKQKDFEAAQRVAVRHLGALLRGEGSEVIRENTRTLRGRGMSESDAAALAIREARRRKREEREQDE